MKKLALAAIAALAFFSIAAAPAMAQVYCAGGVVHDGVCFSSPQHAAQYGYRPVGPAVGIQYRDQRQRFGVQINQPPRHGVRPYRDYGTRKFPRTQAPRVERRWASRPISAPTAYRCRADGTAIDPSTPPGPGLGWCNPR